MLRRLCLTILVLSIIFITTTCRVKTSSAILDPDRQTTLQPGINEINMEYGGLTRDLTIHLPASFNPDSAYPIVFFFHGLGGNKGMGQAVVGPLVDDEGFIGIYPQGHLDSWNTGGNEIPSTEDDVGWTLHILNWLESEISLDEDRIYSAGYSNGGAFSYYLALRTDVFAAVASLSASFFVGRAIPDSVQRLSVIQMHGELDEAVPYEGGRSSYLPITFQSAMNTVKQWAVHDGLGDEPEIHTLEDRVSVYTFREDDNPYEVRLYRLHETDHNIGLHPFVSSLRCYQEIWEFFQQHPKTVAY